MIPMLRNQHQEQTFCSSISQDLENGNLTHLDTRQGNATTETCIFPGTTTLGRHNTTHMDPPLENNHGGCVFLSRIFKRLATSDPNAQKPTQEQTFCFSISQNLENGKFVHSSLVKKVE